MQTLKDHKILLGITGGIAAYKSAELVRRLRDQGAEVRVVMTASATEFITPLTLQAVSSNSVGTELFDLTAELGMGHIEQAKWADLILIAPATANFLAKVANGLGNDLLSTLILATEKPVVFAPAMNQAMWANAATQRNIQTIGSYGYHIWGPASGIQACGDVGFGRMLESENLVERCGQFFHRGSLEGKKVVITAGPTREAIDPVRYISNHSSGKMGYALAEAAKNEGAAVILISGPTNQPIPQGVQVVHVLSAEDMNQAAHQHCSDCDIFIAAAAVADYKMKEVADHKMKKGADSALTLELVKNPDIVAGVANSQYRPKCVVGFAAETQNVAEYARRKLKNKRLDAIIANDVSEAGVGFNSDNNRVTVFTKTEHYELETMSKRILATKLVAMMSGWQE